MAHVYADRVKETTTSTGTGTLSLGGAVSSFRTFASGIGTGNTTTYAIVHQTLAEWEVGIGTVTSGTPDTLSRTTILASSNAGAAVSLSAGTKDVFCTMAAARTVLKDASGNLGIGTTAPDALLTVNGIASFGDGAASTPSIAHKGDLNTGLWFPAANTVAVSTNGAERLRIDASGNVSIGTTSTTYTLQVAGSFAAQTKSFIITHPTQPTKKLQYGSLESPYHGVRLTGEGMIAGTRCRIALPEYIAGLCHQEGAQVQITNIRHGKVLWVNQIDVAQQYFEVGCTRRVTERTPYQFYWTFTGIRKDVPLLAVEHD